MSSSSGLGGAGAGGFFPAPASSQQSPPPPAPFQKVSFPLVLLKPNQPGVECILEVGETLRLVRANGVQLFRFQYSQVKRCPHLRTDATCNCKSHSATRRDTSSSNRRGQTEERPSRRRSMRCKTSCRTLSPKERPSPGRPTMQAAMTSTKMQLKGECRATRRRARM